MNNKSSMVLNWLKANNVKVVTLILLAVIFVIVSVRENKNLFTSNQKLQSVQQIESNVKKERFNQNSFAITSRKTRTAVIFVHPACHRCRAEKNYINRVLKKDYPDVRFQYHDVTSEDEISLMKTYYRSYGIDERELATPTFFAGYDYVLGYENDKTTGKDLKVIIDKNFFGKKTEASTKYSEKKESGYYVNTWFGKINVFKESLIALAIILGLVDGFNPCAIWVLIYLITLIARLNDKRKVWLIVGSFLLASGVLYYLFMTALLEVFLYIGYLRILQLLIGCVALYVGVIDLAAYIQTKGRIFCKIEDAEAKEKTKTRVQKLVAAELSFMTILGVIALAFAVNSIEFVCSSALPAIYTSVLSQASLSMLQYQLYILLYVIFFMLDDIIIFGFAAFAINRFIGDRFIGPSKLIGGIILSTLGIMMIFFPGYMR